MCHTQAIETKKPQLIDSSMVDDKIFGFCCDSILAIFVFNMNSIFEECHTQIRHHNTRNAFLWSRNLISWKCSWIFPETKNHGRILKIRKRLLVAICWQDRSQFNIRQIAILHSNLMELYLYIKLYAILVILYVYFQL